MENNSVVGDRVAPDDLDLLVQLTEYTNDCLWMFTADWKEVVFVNSAYEDIFGSAVEELERDPRNFLESIHPEDREETMGAMETLAGGEPVDIEFRVNPDEDYQTWAWVQAQPVIDDSGAVVYVAGYTRDVTERKVYQRKLERHRQELEQSNESLREFAYIASHDLQEPLRMVSSYVELLDQEYGDQFDDEAREYMEFAISGAKRMKQMINSLLDYSRVHTDAKEFGETDANAVFESSRQDLELLIAEHDAELSVGDLPTIQADADQLGQIFQNLVRNAINHASDDQRPKIEVTATERDDAYEFAVADNGPGVPPDQREDIFGIFKQGATSAKNANTGIGLAITQRIVQRHGGDIWVEPTESDDSGATFRFTIPKPKTSETLRGDEA